MKFSHAISQRISDLNGMKMVFIINFLIIFRLSGFGQELKFSNSWASLTQSVDVTAYRGKKFRLRAAVKVIGKDGKESKAQLWARVDLEGGVGRGFFYNMSDRPITTSSWAVYSFEGEIHQNAKNLFFGGLVYSSGQFYFDDFKVSVQNDNGEWELVPIRNGGFEEPIDTSGLPAGWTGSISRILNYRAERSGNQAYQGNHALVIRSDGYLVLNEVPVKEVNVQSHLHHLTKENGLPEIAVTSLLQDRQGFIWIGTENGLIRYDGYSSLVFQNDPSDSLSLSDSDVTVLFEDRSERLWIGTQSGGINLFNPETEQFRQFKHHPEDSLSLSHNTVTAIYQDQEGFIWISGRRARGLNRLDPKSGQVKRFLPNSQKPLGLKNPWITAIAEDNAGRLWLGTYSGGIVYFDREKEQFFPYYSLEGAAATLGTKNILAIRPEKNGKLWLGSETGYYQFDPDTREFVNAYRFESEGLPSSFYNIVQDSLGGIWLNTLKEVIRFHPGKNQFQVYKFTNRSDHFIFCIMVDREGVIWLGTSIGIMQINPFKDQFKSHPVSSVYPQELGSIEINGSILEDSENLLWVGTVNHLYQTNLHNKKINLFKQDGRESSLGKKGLYQVKWNSDKKPSQLSQNDSIQNHILALYEDLHQDIWISMYNRGLGQWNRKTKEFNYFGTKGTNAIRYIFSILEDRYGTLWLGTWAGAYKFNRATESFHLIPWKSDNGEGRKWTRISAIIKDREATLWMGTEFGELRYFNDQTGLFHDVTPDGVDTEVSYGKDAISCIYEDRNGSLWIGTIGNGFWKFDKKKQTYTYFTQREGLVNNRVSSILEDDNDNLWISTHGGLSRFDPDTQQFRNYNTTDGLLSNELGDLHIGQNSGAFYLSSNNGLMAFHPDSIRDNTLIPPIVISSLKKYNKEIDEEFLNVKGISEKEEITLSFKDDILVFEFAALSYSKNSNNQYAYRLKGLNDQWIKLGTKRDITFSNLSPGLYTLQVKGSNGDGIWNETGTSLKITITPPWYWAWYTKTLYLLILTGALYALYRWRTREQRNKIALQEKALAQEQLLNARLRQIDQLKDQFLANTSHELRTPLHGIIGIAESLFDSVKKRSAEEIQHNLGLIMTSGRRLASLVNDLLDFSRVKNRDLQLQPKSLNLHAVADVVLHSCQPLLGSNPIELINDVPPNFPPVLADENRLQQILYNLIGNAIKFTREGYVKVGAIQQSADGRFPPTEKGPPAEDYILITIQDTGIGIPTEKQETIFQSFEQADGDTAREFGGTGLGLSITRQLVELHGGNIWVESMPGQGSTFFFTLPLSDQPTQLSPKVPKASTPTPSRIAGVKLSPPVAVAAEDRIRILVVDDEPINHQVLRNHLGEEQFLITSVMSGQEAIEAIDLGVTFDLVLLDVMMPRISGYEVCQKIRQKYLPSELPVIMVTAKNQIQDLVEGLGVGANDYLAKPFSRDEFLARVKTQLDLHRINEVTGKFVPNAFIRAIGRERITEVKLGDFVQKEITVLFSDIRDYTTLSEKMTPEQNYKFVNAFNGRMGPVIRRHHGFINQYLGDAIMALFPEKPADALQAAVDMQRVLHTYNQERIIKGRHPLKMGLGLHTGPLIMGIIGDKERLDAATISDTVNTTSRIEDLTKHFGANILVSGASLPESAAPNRTSLFETFGLRYLGKVQVKGKTETIGLYECFDGDSATIAERKAQTLPDFETAMAHYFAREFPEASAIYSHILKINPDDRVVRWFLNQAAYYIQKGVPENWSGVEHVLEH